MSERTSDPSNADSSSHEQPLIQMPAPTRSHGFLAPAAGAWILGLDWLLFSQNALSLGLGTPISVVGGFLFRTAGTFVLQRRIAGDSALTATWKALLAGIAVGIPWPIFGTVVGGWILVASGLSRLKRDGTDNANERRQ